MASSPLDFLGRDSIVVGEHGEDETIGNISYGLSARVDARCSSEAPDP
jgi:hypothetical protein